ncbi:MAG TPA: alpha/beta hydrolase [Phenylobacterium sp.]|jgi:pimeloyl-ACP methyl ester carboxylesterase
MRRFVWALIAAAFLGASAAHAQTAPEAGFGAYLRPQQLVAVGPGRSINLVCMGQGAPTVILSDGGASWSLQWFKVQPMVARKTRVCAWDRAGNGFSGASSEPQDVAHTEADLEAALKGAGVTGPLVLVGHSVGGFESLLFADRNRDRVAGMVLVDPSYPDQVVRLARAAPALMQYSNDADRKGLEHYRRCIDALKAGGRDPPPGECVSLRAGLPEPMRAAMLGLTTDPAYWQTFLSLFELKDRNARLAVNPRRDYSDMPLIVMGSGVVKLPGAPEAIVREIPALDAELQSGLEALAHLSSRGSYVRVPESGHAIQLQKPAAVIQAIETVVEQARRPPGR